MNPLLTLAWNFIHRFGVKSVILLFLFSIFLRLIEWVIYGFSLVNVLILWLFGDFMIIYYLCAFNSKRRFIMMTDPNDLSNSNNKINGTDFELMIEAVDNWNNSEGTLKWVYIRKDGVKQATFISKAKFDEMKLRWDIEIGTEQIQIDIPETPTTPATPAAPAFEISYYVNPNSTPDYVLADIKSEGANGILLKVSRLTSSTNYFGAILPDMKTKCQAAGLKLRAWLSGNLNSDNTRMDSRLASWQTSINEMVVAVKAIAALGIPVHVDLDNGELAANVDQTNAYIKALRDAIPSNIDYTITSMPNAQGYDNSLAYGENYATLIPDVTNLSPELYGYNYTADPMTMTNAIKGMVQQFGNKILPSIQIISDTGATLTVDQINAQIKIMKDAGCPGVFVFRWFGKPATSAQVSQDCYVEPKYEEVHQPDDYTCGPTSSVMALYTLGIIDSIDDLANLEQTIRAPGGGTSPDEIIAGITADAAKFGVTVQCNKQSFDSLGLATFCKYLADPNIAIIAHGMLDGWTSYYTSKGIGHFVYPIKYCYSTDTFTIADPDRDIITYKSGEFLAGVQMISEENQLIIIKKV